MVRFLSHIRMLGCYVTNGVCKTLHVCPHCTHVQAPGPPYPKASQVARGSRVTYFQQVLCGYGVCKTFDGDLRILEKVTEGKRIPLPLPRRGEGTLNAIRFVDDQSLSGPVQEGLQRAIRANISLRCLISHPA